MIAAIAFIVCAPFIAGYIVAFFKEDYNAHYDFAFIDAP